MTHAELVARAERWLRNTIGCGAVLTELTAYTRSGEVPDAIGWSNGRSILVECKTTRSDFQADRLKRARRPDIAAIGHWRFYLAPPGVLDPDGLPYGWGLYEVHGRSVRHAGGRRYANATTPPFREPCLLSEIAMLVSALRRIQAEEMTE